MRRALIVGIDGYPHAPLSGCVKDAKRMHEVLAKHSDGSPNFACKTLLAPKEYISRSKLRKKLKDLFGHEAEVALFYFSGHGTVNNLGGYLVTQDATNYDEGVAMDDVLTLANNANIDEVIIILDCCHSGALGALPAIDNERAVLREGVSVLTASRASQVAIEMSGGGVFTSLVYDALNGGAADVGGNVTVAAVYAYVDQALGAEQRPLFKSHVSTLIPLRKCEPAVALSTLRLLPKYFSSPDFEFPLDPSFEPDAEPRNTEHEAIFSRLQEYRDARLLAPTGVRHLYDAAIEEKTCQLRIPLQMTSQTRRSCPGNLGKMTTPRSEATQASPLCT